MTNLPSPEAAAESAKLDVIEKMSERLAAAIEQDIAALEDGKFTGMRLTDPEIENLCTQYGREVAALKKSGGVKHASDAVKARMKKAGARLKKALDRHQLLAGAMRHTSEGIVQAVANEVMKKRERETPYAAGAKGPGFSRSLRATQGSALVYNKVV